MKESSFEEKLATVETLIAKISSHTVSVADLAKDYKKANELLIGLTEELETIEKDIELNLSFSTVTESKKED